SAQSRRGPISRTPPRLRSRRCRGREPWCWPIASGDGHAFSEFQQLRRQRRLLSVVLPRRVTGYRPPLVDNLFVEIDDLCALGSLDFSHLLVVRDGFIGAELLGLKTKRH